MSDMDIITLGLIEDINEIRLSGEVNMLDRDGVQMIANDMEYYDLVVWIQNNQDHYMTLLRSMT